MLVYAIDPIATREVAKALDLLLPPDAFRRAESMRAGAWILAGASAITS